MIIKDIAQYEETDSELAKFTINNLQTTIDSNTKSYNKLAKYSDELEDRIDEINNINEKISLALESAENRLDKAIEYIEERYDGEVLTHTFSKENVGELLNILKGVDKE